MRVSERGRCGRGGGSVYHRVRDAFRVREGEDLRFDMSC